jgi:hypothetical protein
MKVFVYTSVRIEGFVALITKANDKALAALPSDPMFLSPSVCPKMLKIQQNLVSFCC